MHFVSYGKKKKSVFMEHISFSIGASGNFFLLHIIIGETKSSLPVAYARKGDFPCAPLRAVNFRRALL